MPLEQIVHDQRVECQQLGIERADLAITMTDGRAGLGDCLIEHSLSGLAHETVRILEFSPAAEHVHGFAQIAFDLQTSATRAVT